MQDVANKIAIHGTTCTGELFWGAARTWDGGPHLLSPRHVGQNGSRNDN